MNCIIGPNGSGKSNIGDAICFMLGRLSSKDLRADNYSELVFKKKGGKSVGEAEVYFQLDNSSGAFNIDSKVIEIRRKIKKSGQTQYKLNGKNVTRQQILELLTPQRIHPDGHNIVLQGDIARFVDMRPVEKRQVIEEVSGIGIYEERKQKTLKELEKVEEKLKEAQIIVAEKETFLKNLEKDKEEAEKFQSAKELLEAAKATEINLRLKNLEKKKETNLANIEKNIAAINKFKDEIENIKTKLEELRKESAEIDETIRKRGGEEDLKLRKEIEELRINIEKSKALVETSEKEISRFENRQADLKNNLKEIERKIAEKQKEKKELEKKLKELSKSAKPQKGLGFEKVETQLESCEKKIESLQNKKAEIISDFQNAQTELKVIEHQIENLKERLSEFGSEKEFDAKSAKERYKKLVDEINKIASQDSRLALRLGELKKDLIKKEEELTKAKIHAGSAQELLMRDLAIRTIMNKKIKGVHGTVADLGKVEDKFSLALQVAAGGRLKNIVVETPDIAIKCLNLLKESKAGIATFLPLSKLKSPAKTTLPKKKGVYGFAHELISCENKFKQIFKYVFGNTLVVEDVNAAKGVGIGNYRMVTLEGDLFELSGAISGGYRKRGMGVGFESKDSSIKINQLEQQIDVIKKEIGALEKERGSLDVKLIELRKEKVELESKIELYQKIGGKDKKKDIENKIKEFLAKQKEYNSKISSLKKEIEKLDNEIKKEIAQRDALRLKAKDLRAKLRAGEDELTKTKERLAVISAEIENALLPEKENILNVLKSLEKDALLFKKQIKEEEEKCKKLEKALREKEKEELKAQSKLRDLYAKKGELNELIRKEEDKLLSAKEQLNKFEQEKNTLAILKAEIEGELAGLKEEFKPYEGKQLLENIKTIEEAKKKIRYLERKIAEMGNVNLKALEAYEVVKKEYEELAWKLSKLETEKADILEVIEEIEKKKKDAFLKTFNEIAKNFEAIFSKIAEKHIAKLQLENEEAPFEGGINVSVTDAKGKRISLASLSGGEKVLVALAFLFAIQEYEPAPFYLFDEIDAALDKVNSEKVAKLLKEYGKKAQIIVISHNDAVISEADALYGVSMNKETGESNVVSLKI